MDETPHPMPNTDNGELHGTPLTHLRLPDLPDFKLGVEGDLNGFAASDSEFLQFVHSLVPLTGENLDQWTWEERRDFLNWCLDEQVLTIQDGRLVPVEETIPTTPLTSDTEGDASSSAEEVEFLHDVARARPAIDANPTISANELAEALGLHSEGYAQTVKDSVNAHQSEEKGTDTCSHE